MFPNITFVNFEEAGRLSWMNLQPHEVNRDQVRWCLCYRAWIGSSNLVQAVACLILLLVACLTAVAMLVYRTYRKSQKQTKYDQSPSSDRGTTRI